MIGICGASGLLGWGLCNYLLERGEKVMGTYYQNKKPGLVKFNMLTDDFSIFDNCDFVIIVAAKLRWYCEKYPRKAFKLNVQKTMQLIRYLGDKKIKTLFISSVMAVTRENRYGLWKSTVENFIRINFYKQCWFIRPGKITEQNLEELCKSIYLKIQDC